MTDTNKALAAGDQVIFDNRIHWIVSVFPRSSKFYGMLLLNWVKNPKPISAVVIYDEVLHKTCTVAKDIVD